MLKMKVEEICAKQGISPSALYRWYGQFDFNSANFGLVEYEKRLGRKFPFQGKDLLLALIDFLKGEDLPANPCAADYGGLFEKLQHILASPVIADDQNLPILGIFRTTLDRGG